MSEEESAGETAYEHNMRYSNAIGQYVNEVDKAVALLTRAEYRVFTKKEFEQRHRVQNVIVILISLTSICLGIAIGVAYITGRIA